MNKYFLSAGLVVLSFSLALAQPSPTNPTSPSSGTGIEGAVVISPTHPGPIRQGAPESKPLPHTKFVVERAGENKPVGSFTTDERGHFSLSLPPGHYTVVKEGGKGGIGNFGPFEVEVTAGKMTSMGELQCDSGMR